MKKHLSTTVLYSLSIVLLTSAPSFARMKNGNVFTIGARYHTEHAVFNAVPYDDGDMSLRLAYEYHEANAFWQLVLGYAPDASNGTAVDYVFTPEINIVVKDGVWRAGVGVLTSYVADDTEEWSDIYWQFMAGASFPVFGVSADVMTYYLFEEFSDFQEWELEDMEFGVMVRLPF